MNSQLLQGDCKEKLKEIESNSMDLLCSDFPYGYAFMNKEWDKALVSVDTLKECLRVLKPGAFAFIMCAPRQDVHARMVINLQDAGFKVDFTSIFYTYASGFPKASNISKMVDKRFKKREEYFELGNFLKLSRLKLNKTIKDVSKFFPSKTGGLTGCVSNWENASNVPTLSQWVILKKELQLDDSFDWLIEQETKRYEEAQREVIGKDGRKAKDSLFNIGIQKEWDITKSSTNQAKKLDGSYAGFQPKPAVEVILVVMKPLSEKNYVEQAMSNGKGITWLDDCRIPFKGNLPWNKNRTSSSIADHEWRYGKNFQSEQNNQGRFPANLLVSDDALNDNKNHKVGKIENHHKITSEKTKNNYGKYNRKSIESEISYGDSGSFSRYFDLDSWQAQFIIAEKASKSEKNAGLELNDTQTVNDGRTIPPDNAFQRGATDRKNTHPTVKPISLMSYLITMGSKEGDIVLDPFCGSGTTLIASSLLKRKYVGIELNPEYVTIAQKRLDYWKNKSFEKLEKIKKQAEKEKIVKLEAFV